MSFPGDATVSEVGEFPLIERLRNVFAQGEQVLVGPGDDALVGCRHDSGVVTGPDLGAVGPLAAVGQAGEHLPDQGELPHVRKGRVGVEGGSRHVAHPISRSWPTAYRHAGPRR
jgi:hypothetical protein